LLKILVVDDDKELRSSVVSALKSKYSLEEAEDGVVALEKVRSTTFDLVMLDVDMPRMRGLECLKAIKSYDPRIIVVIMTAYTNLKDAVEAIREGAYNYVSKPIKHEEIKAIVEKAFEAHDLIKVAVYSAPTDTKQIDKEFIGGSQSMKKVFGLIEKLARVDTAVLIRGESGTGKELVARAIHMNSLKKDKNFVPVNCSAIPENLIESELFGHEKGAFTGADKRKIGKFQYAEGGTLFLDEIGDLPVSMQAKLLRVLQDKKFTPVGANREVEVNVRIITATNRNLEEMIKSGTFREDLFYRLNVLPIFLPSLRDRKEDIESLVSHFIRKFNFYHKKEIKGLSGDVVAKLKEYNWPGNIRELENVIEHAFVLEEEEEITVGSLPASIFSPLKLEKTSLELNFKVYKEEMEKEFIMKALRAFDGKINQTAERANIPKKTLLRKIDKYKIDKSEFKIRD
jgi:two-component system, NtrC family, response regulator AtoC